jgi:peptidoglycan/LPS O-acetylase OafA/YrhL
VRSKILFLEYLRIYAFLAVLFGHKFHYLVSISVSSVSSIGVDTYNFVAPFLVNGGTGVIVFFLVSGYIMEKVIDLEAPLEFLVKRAFRIYPAYIFCVLAQFCLVDGAVPGWGALWPRFCLLGDFMATPQVLNGVDWTLRLELLFYLLMSILCFFRRAFRFTGGSVIFIVSIVLFFMFSRNFPAWGPSTLGFYNRFFPFLLLGVAVSMHERGGLKLLWVLLLFVVVSINYFARLNVFGSADAYVVVGCAIFFLAWRFREFFPDSVLVRNVASLTYCVYLIHNWFFEYAEGIFGRLEVGHPPLLALSAILLFALIVHVLIERPFLVLGKKLAPRF